MACLLCGGPVSEPESLAPTKPWWPLMVACLDSSCAAFGVHVAADPDALEIAAEADYDSTEPKFAYTAGDDWYVSTIYRRTSAMDGPRWYYETQAFVRVVGERYRTVYWHSVGWPKGTLRGHAIFAKRLSRQLGRAVAA